jgi:hypothetical protein
VRVELTTVGGQAAGWETNASSMGKSQIARIGRGQLTRGWSERSQITKTWSRGVKLASMDDRTARNT